MYMNTFNVVSKRSTLCLSIVGRDRTLDNDDNSCIPFEVHPHSFIHA